MVNDIGIDVSYTVACQRVCPNNSQPTTKYMVNNRIKQLYAISINASPKITVNIRSGKILHLWREDIHASTHIPT